MVRIRREPTHCVEHPFEGRSNVFNIVSGAASAKLVQVAGSIEYAQHRPSDSPTFQTDRGTPTLPKARKTAFFWLLRCGAEGHGDTAHMVLEVQ